MLAIWGLASFTELSCSTWNPKHNTSHLTIFYFRKVVQLEYMCIKPKSTAELHHQVHQLIYNYHHNFSSKCKWQPCWLICFPNIWSLSVFSFNNVTCAHCKYHLGSVQQMRNFASSRHRLLIAKPLSILLNKIDTMVVSFTHNFNVSTYLSCQTSS